MEVRELYLIPEKERPREKLLSNGAEYLSDLELLAVILGSGTKNNGVNKVAAGILELLDRTDHSADIDALSAVKGIGKVKAARIAAALEFSRRIILPGTRKIGFPGDILPVISHYSDRKQEYFLCLSLNGAHEVMNSRVVSVGLVNRTIVHPREVYADPLIDRAAAVIVAHNHPSGNIQPSREDIEITVRLKKSGETLGIQLLDHIIFSVKGYYSFLEDGKI